jgi:hypothetical protein
MPLPKPKKGEASQDFISRGMANPVMKREFPDTKQRLAVLYNILREKRGKSRVPEKKNRNCNEKHEMYALMANIRSALDEDEFDTYAPKPVGTVVVGGKILGFYFPSDSKLVYLSLVMPALRMGSAFDTGGLMSGLGKR